MVVLKAGHLVELKALMMDAMMVVMMAVMKVE